MQSFWASRAHSYYPNGIHPALKSFANEWCSMLAPLMAYVGALALLAIAGFHLWDLLPAGDAVEPSAKVWSLATRSYPAFAVSQFDLAGKTETYEIFRHPEGGRKDVFHWAGQDEKPVAELEIYRPGGELAQSEPAIAEIAARMDPTGLHELETAGIIDSKFGTVTLLRLTGSADDVPACLGFIKRLDEPDLRISGWSCQGDTWPARRAAVGCILSRLILLTAGNDPKLAELFARAELKRASCGPTATPGASADWVTGAENPKTPLQSLIGPHQPRCWYSCNFFVSRCIMSDGVAQLTL